MTTSPDGRARRGEWLVLPLLLAVLLAPAICWCSRGVGGHCNAGTEETVASCHGPSPGGSRTPPGSPEPCPPGHDCGCVASGYPVAKVSEGPALDASTAVPLTWPPLAALAPTQGGTGSRFEPSAVPRPPGPAVYLLVRSIRC